MEIRKTTPEDVDALMAIFDGARRFMAAHGNGGQWINGHPERALIEQDVAQGQSYVVTEDGRILATFMLLESAEPTYQVIDGAWLNDEPYGTLHRVASTGEKRGTTDFIISWAFERTGNLRGDTHEQNTPMRKAFERNGFVPCGTVWMENGSPRIAYHKIK